MNRTGTATNAVRACALILSMMLVAAPCASFAKTLRVAIPGFPTLGLNPLTSTNLPPLYTFAAIFDALTWVDEHGAARPQVAVSWTAANELTWVFKLRNDVRFSDGTPLTAKDVVFAIDLLHSPVGRSYTVNVELPSLRAGRVIDATTVEITTWTPNPFLPQELSLVRLPSPRAWGAGGDAGFNANPVGSGPFKVVTQDPARMVLTANPHAWRKPKVDRLELIAAPDPITRTQGILSGRVDLTFVLGPDQIPQLEAEGHRVVVTAEPAIILLAFITEKQSPLTDVRVRQALNYAVDKQRIVDAIMAGHGRVASQTAAANAFGFDPQIEPYPYDPDRARQLLAEAGYPEGFSMVGEIYSGTSSFATLVYQQTAADLLRVGVKLDLQLIPIPQYARGLHQGDWRGVAFGIDYNAEPSYDALRGFYRHSCLWKVPWYCDREIMPVLEKALATFDLDERKALTHQILRRQRDQAPGILLYDQIRFDAVANRVSGYRFLGGYVPYDEIDVND
ncbi:MAG: ABC transporter substrate-binding protein [Rhodobacteraceae bacterium]|nr:ABC transporter substrate-binding protein [Paracoccaceae bacterium]